MESFEENEKQLYRPTDTAVVHIFFIVCANTLFVHDLINI